MKMYGAAFLYLHFGFEIFRQNNINAKVADKMLMKFTIAVNFINILQAAFAPISLKITNTNSTEKSCTKQFGYESTLGIQTYFLVYFKINNLARVWVR